jgi:RimJ/RimL family protein N-acetyltransferase
MDGKILSVTGDQQALTTDRLTLEPLRDEHTDSIIELFTEPAMSAYLGMDFTRKDTAEAMMQRRLAYSGPPELGHWAFIQGDTMVGLGHLRPSWELPGALPEIGWYLAPRHGRRGLATEAARALLRYGLDQLRLHSVWALIHADNTPSLRLADRLGFLCVGSGVHYGAQHHVHVALPGV